MNRGYAIGVGIGLSLLAIAGAISYSRLPPPPMMVAFTTKLVDRSYAPVVHHQRHEVVLKLQNRGKGRVHLDAVRFNQPFVHVGSEITLPMGIPAGSTISLPVELAAEPPHWGQQDVQVTAAVTNGRESHDVSTVILWDIAAHINPDPPLVQFPRVKRTDQVPSTRLRLWYAQGGTPPIDVEVKSLDPAVRVTTMPLDEIQNGRHYVLELLIEIDAGLAQPQHRSQLVVRAKGNEPPVIIPVVGWVDE